MIHLNFHEFKDVLNTLKGGSWNSTRGIIVQSTVPDFLIGQWYAQYLKYENDWYYYFHNIFLPNLNPTEDCTINIVLYESGPGGFSFPHPNYMFLSEMLDQPIYNQHMDKYINRVLDLAGITASLSTRREKLSELAKNGYLIIDLLPTHGITLKNRIKIWENDLVRTKALEKVETSKKITGKKLKCEDLETNYFASREVKNNGAVVKLDDLSKIIGTSTKI